MIRANRMRARFHAMFAWMCLIALTFGAGAVRALSQSPAGSDGWHIPEGAAVEPNPEALNPTRSPRGGAYTARSASGVMARTARGTARRPIPTILRRISPMHDA